MRRRTSLWPQIVDTRTPSAVYGEVRRIVRVMQPGFAFDRLSQAFHDIVALFSGRYPGYKACNTGYHDLTHTMDTVLAMARILQGAASDGLRVTRRNIGLGLTAALMHDTGYLQRTGDRSGTGGKYTVNHMERSIKFMEEYFLENGYSIDYFEDAKKVLKCTSLAADICRIRFRSEELRVIGKMLATVDILGQMGHRNYLEKLLLLYRELREAKIAGYDREIDVFKRTFAFYEMAKRRLEGDLSDMKAFMISHFRTRFGLERDFYLEQIENNLKHLCLILENEGNYRRFLRRAGIVNSLNHNKVPENR